MSSSAGQTGSSPDEPLAVRSYEEADEAELLELWRDAFPDNPAWKDPRADIVRKLRVQRELLLVGHWQRRLVASVMAGYDGHRGWIYYVAVAPDCRRLGFGSEIVRAAEARLAEFGCSKINLQVRPHNRQVVAFYERLGYVVEPRISMAKRIDS